MLGLLLKFVIARFTVDLQTGSRMNYLLKMHLLAPVRADVNPHRWHRTTGTGSYRVSVWVTTYPANTLEFETPY